MGAKKNKIELNNYNNNNKTNDLLTNKNYNTMYVKEEYIKKGYSKIYIILNKKTTIGCFFTLFYFLNQKHFLFYA